MDEKQYKSGISILKLTKRTFNSLMRAHIDTIEKLLTQDEDSLKNIKNMGVLSVAEVLEVINKIKENGVQEYINAYDMEISALGLSERTTNALLGADIVTLNDLLLQDEASLSCVRNMGVKSVSETLSCIDYINKFGIDSYFNGGRETLKSSVVYEMPYDDLLESKIEVLNFSTRTFNGLMREGITTVAELLNQDEDSLKNISYLGTKSINEALDVIQRIKKTKEGTDEYAPMVSTLVSTLTEKADLRKTRFFSEAENEYMSTIGIEVLGLSARSSNILCRNGIFTMDKLCQLSDEQMEGFHNLGVKSKEEIIHARATWIENNLIGISNPSAEECDSIPTEIVNLFKKFSKFTIWPSTRFVNVLREDDLYDYVVEHGDEIWSKNDYIYVFDKSESIGKTLEVYCKKKLNDDYITVLDFEEDLEEDFDDDSIRQAIFDYLIEHCFVKDRDYLLLKGITIENYVKDLKNEKYKGMVEERLAGKTLQEIGEQCGISRERARQIIAKVIRLTPKLFEDRYSRLFCYFRLDKAEFYEIFPNEKSSTYEYLSVKFSKGTAELNERNIEEYEGLFKSQLEEYYVISQKQAQRRKMTRVDIGVRVLVHNSGKYITKEEFDNQYCEYLISHDLADRIKSYNQGTMMNRFRLSNHVVFNREAEMRYYAEDASVLWKKIKFGKYNNSVITSELIFRDYPDLMEELDIWNGYELFCLLKNTESPLRYNDNVPNIQFRRIPVIIVGDGDEERQAKKLVKELAPIEYGKYYEAYEERFGLRKESAIANIGKYIDEFLTPQGYMVEAPEISDEDIDEFERIISSKDLWTLPDVEKIFDEVCVNSSVDALNALTFKKMNYVMHPGCIHSDKYTGIAEAFIGEYFNKDVIDLQDIPADINRLSAFRALVDRLRYNWDYLDVDKNITASIGYLTRTYGIDKEFIKEYQAQTAHLLTDKYFNADSLWGELSQIQMTKAFRGNKWLCNSVLHYQDGVYGTIFTNNHILSKDGASVGLADLSEWIVDIYGKMSAEKIASLLTEKFNIGVNKYRLLEKIRGRGIESKLLTDNIEEYLDQLAASAESFEQDDFFEEEFF